MCAIRHIALGKARRNESYQRGLWYGDANAICRLPAMRSQLGFCVYILSRRTNARKGQRNCLFNIDFRAMFISIVIPPTSSKQKHKTHLAICASKLGWRKIRQWKQNRKLTICILIIVSHVSVNGFLDNPAWRLVNTICGGKVLSSSSHRDVSHSSYCFSEKASSWWFRIFFSRLIMFGS